MAQTLYSLLVGIDAYRPPVPALKGCVNDITRVEELLPLLVDKSVVRETRKLVDAQASRTAVIKAFREHLGQAGPEDIALFYYSGHGAFEEAPQEFWPDEPDHLNETLVCHDSRDPGSWDLADKELGLLIGELSAAGPRLLVVLDCCHSGSGTRTLLSGSNFVRSAPNDHRTRTIADYLSDQVAPSRDGAQSGWRLPSGGSHVLLAACRSDETAKEVTVDGRQRGAFSAALEEVLKSSGGNLSYRDLTAAISNQLAKSVRNQTPQLECFGDQRPTQSFLGGATRAHTGYWTMTHSGGRWWVDAGSLTGLAPGRGREKAVFAVFPGTADAERRRDLTRSLGTATATSVEPGRAEVDVELRDQNIVLDEDKPYLCVLISPPMARVAVRPPDSPDDGDVRVALGASLLVRAAEEAEDAELVVLAGPDGFRVHDPRTGPIAAAGTPGTTAAHAETIVRQLDHIVCWRLLRDLANPGAALSSADLEITVFDSTGAELPADQEIRMLYLRPTEPPTLKIRVRNTGGRELHCALYGLTEDYEIGSLLQGGAVAKLAPGEEVWALGGDPVFAQVPKRLWQQGVSVCQDVVKVLASTAPFDANRLTEDALTADEPTRSAPVRGPIGSTLDRLLARIPSRSLSARPEDDQDVVDWIAKSVLVTVERPLEQRDLQGGRADLDGGVVLKAPTGVTCGVRLVLESATTRDLAKPAIPALLRDISTPFPLRVERGDADLSVIELHDVENPQLVDRNNPVLLTVPTTLESGETALVVAYDGEFYLPVGRVRDSDETGTTFAIDQLPEEASSTRGLGKSIRLMLRKLVGDRLGLPDNHATLAVATVDGDGNAQYNADEDAVRAAVGKAKRILLLVHGIIGETTGMVTGTADLHDRYDLVLAFDYENIKTKITANATKLRDLLGKAGVSPAHHLDVVAHSMGGLVVRAMIEISGEKTLVDRLVTAGTPNGGSPWPKVQDWATTALAAGLNGLAGMFWPAAPFGALVGLIERVDDALDDLDPGSDLVRDLFAAKDPAHRYVVLIGDRSLVGKPEGLFTRLLVNPAVSLVFFKEPNDIAVAITSGRHLPEPRDPAPAVHVIKCDHMTYFSSDEGRQAIREALEGP